MWAAGGKAIHLQQKLPTEYGRACTAPIPIACESTLHDAVVASSPKQFGMYSCATHPTTGGEVYYKLVNPVGGRITVTLQSRDADLDLIAVGASGGGCNVGTCKGASHNSGTAADTITLDPATRGNILYFIVDGATTANSAYTISVDCTKL